MDALIVHLFCNVRLSMCLANLWSAQFRDVLPLEIREMVYEYDWHPSAAEQAFSNVYDEAISTQSWLVKCGASRCRCFHYRTITLWVQHQFVGVDVAQEAAKAYYKHMPPARLKDISLIRPFLNTYHWHLGLIPANHIQRLTLTVDREALTSVSMIRSLSRDGYPTIRLHFDCLRKLRLKHNFLLSLTFKKDASGHYTETGLKYFSQVHGDLSDAGAKIEVYGYPDNTRDFMSFPLRIDCYYDMSKEEWVR
jgi:hypothetical protein